MTRRIFQVLVFYLMFIDYSWVIAAENDDRAEYIITAAARHQAEAYALLDLKAYDYNKLMFDVVFVDQEERVAEVEVLFDQGDPEQKLLITIEYFWKELSEQEKTGSKMPRMHFKKVKYEKGVKK